MKPVIKILLGKAHKIKPKTDCSKFNVTKHHPGLNSLKILNDELLKWRICKTKF